MAIAVYNPTTHQVLTFIRDDHGGYAPPLGFELVADFALPPGWSYQQPDFDEAKADKLRTLKAWWAAHEAAGVTPAGASFALGITPGDVGLLNGAFTLARTAVALEAKTPADTFPIIDRAGGVQWLTLAQMTDLLLAYGEARAQLSAAYALYLAAIQAAVTHGDLAAIEIV